MGLLNRVGVEERLAAEELGTTSECLCHEPWESYYILRRGILPCCHGSKPIAPMEDFERAWNAPALQEIRKHLARGRLSPYCLESTGCPIVRRHLHAQRTRERWLPDRVRTLGKLNRLLGGKPARLYYRLVRALS
jgi:hypothetical protein